MRIGLLVGILFATFWARAVTQTVSDLPPSAYADTEVSTNFPLRVDFSRLQKLHIALELDESVSNGLEILLGRDLDEDGSLSSTEASLAFGYDCGVWFVRETESDRFDVEASSATCDKARRELIIGWQRISPAWDFVRITRRGEGEAGESVSLEVENKRFTVIFR